MKITLSGNLLRFSKFQKEIQVSAPTVAEGLSRLCGELPQLRPVLLDGAGQLRKVHRLFVNRDQLMNDELARPVGADDEIMILTALAGG
jgi:molybdopterin synthase sulfur carrier subunit